MTIRQVHIEGALTLEQYRQLEPELTRPLCDGPIGSTTTARRANDAAASSAFDEPDRPAVASRRRAVGPRGTPHDTADDIKRRWDENRRRRAQEAPRATQPPKQGADTPKRSQRRTDAPDGTGVPQP